MASRARPTAATTATATTTAARRGSTEVATKSVPAKGVVVPTASGGAARKKPSATLDKHKAADPFASNKKRHKTNFGYLYNAGLIPCRINHGSVKQQLMWNQSPEDLEYDPLLFNCFEGLCETEHPFVFVARQGIHDLLTAEYSSQKTIPMTGMLVRPIRQALLLPDKDVFKATLVALQLLSAAVGPSLDEHLPLLLVQLAKRSFDKACAAIISDTLQALEANGGDDALKFIKQKVPTYTSINI